MSTVTVLSTERTFWEKATLIHVECHRTEFRSNTDRLSRHWYDLAKLADLKCGKQAVANIELLRDVLRHKKVFYESSTANYDACLTGQFRLSPPTGALAGLREDFGKMIDAGMFVGEGPCFDEIMDRLTLLEQALNASK